MTTLPRPGPLDTLDGPGTELDLLWDQMADVVEATEAVANNAMPNTATAAGELIAGAPAKTTPVDADLLGLSDSAASGVLKQFSWDNLKTALSTIFAVLSGKSGGQTLIGGTAASESLTLKSTSHGTKGVIVLGTASGYDEANDRLGLGTLAPAAKVHAISTTEQARLGYNTSQYARFTVDSTGILLISPTSGEIDLATSSATATLGAELLTTNPSFASDLSGWTDSGSTWSWHASGAAAHTAGSASNLSQNVTVANGSTYQVAVNFSGRTAGTISCTLGSVPVYDYSTITARTSSFARTVVANATGSVTFTITPTTDFDGKIDDVSIKVVTLGSHPSTMVLLQGGTSAGELRLSRALHNFSFGLSCARSITSGIDNSNFGNYAGYGATTGNGNSNFGTYAGYTASIASGGSNFGAYAGYGITTGTSNGNFGYHSGYSITTGSNNNNFGYNCGTSITTGSGNNNIGNHAASNITTGNYNCSYGHNAARYIADGSTSLVNATNCIYIGSSTKASADGVTAENVFGYNATGIGSNTTCIGASSNTKTQIYGDLLLDKTVTAAGTTGAQTIHKTVGSVNFAAAASSLVVTNNRVSTASVILATVATNDTTLKSVIAVAASGSFTLTANAAATAETRVNFLVIN